MSMYRSVKGKFACNSTKAEPARSNYGPPWKVQDMAWRWRMVVMINMGRAGAAVDLLRVADGGAGRVELV